MNAIRSSRNLELYEKLISGEPGTDLAREYGITRTRVYQIFAFMQQAEKEGLIRRVK